MFETTHKFRITSLYLFMVRIHYENIHTILQTSADLTIFLVSAELIINLYFTNVYLVDSSISKHWFKK